MRDPSASPTSAAGTAAPADDAGPLLFAEALAAEQDLFEPGSFPPDELRRRRRELERQLADVADVDERRRRVDSLLAGEVYARLHAAGVRRSALCVSGGGIRSATYGLGILQGLARKGLLRTFDYLSTVSGGGYLGSWLSAWIYRERQKSGGSGAAALAEVERQLASAPPSPLRPEPDPVSHLRSYSRYMSPRFGLLSADTWTLVGLYLRNLLLNWLVLVPLLALFLVLPRGRVWLAQHPPAPALQWALFAVAVAGGVLAIAYIVANRPSLLGAGVSRFPERLRSQPWFLVLCLAPLATMVLALTVFWAWRRWDGETQLAVAGVAVPTPVAFLAFGALLHLAAYLVSRLWVRELSPGEAVAVLLSGALGGLLTWPLAERLAVRDGDHLAPLYAAFAGPLVLGFFLLAATLFVGLASRWMTDADREWLARGGSWMLIAVVVGGAVNAIVFFGPPLLAYLPALFAPLGAISGVATALLGRSGKTPASGDAPGGTPSRSSALAGVALKLAAPVFIVLLLAALALGTTLLVAALARGHEPPPHPKHRFDEHDLLGTLMHAPGWAVAAAALALLVLVAVMGARVDVNRFSLHGAYRDRLIRAYLGASRLPGTRRPDPFTGFDEDDNVPLRELRGNRPFHLVNAALNLVRGTNLAWQDRKAESFTASPLHCGCWQLGYRDAARYGLHPGTDRAISLGTALAISGAAASPNMGYHSSPVVTFLLAFFNVRLGWWLGNPGRHGEKTYDQPGPRFAPRPLISETFGLTNDEHPYVYLSDGGHFDNLGLYEVVLRRCRLVVAIDAEGDPAFQFAGLGGAIAKIRTDFGVPIEFDGPLPMRRYDAAQPAAAGAPPAQYCAVGRIRYSCVDGTPEEEDGQLLYFKASLNGSEPVDVLNYAKTHPAFPHESTGDQLYSESQFESYRALGSHVAEAVLKGFAVEEEEGALEAAFAHVEATCGAAPGGRA